MLSFVEGGYRTKKRGYPHLTLCSLEIKPVPQQWKASASKELGLETHGLESW